MTSLRKFVRTADNPRIARPISEATKEFIRSLTYKRESICQSFVMMSGTKTTTGTNNLKLQRKCDKLSRRNVESSSDEDVKVQDKKLLSSNAAFDNERLSNGEGETKNLSTDTDAPNNTRFERRLLKMSESESDNKAKPVPEKQLKWLCKPRLMNNMNGDRQNSTLAGVRRRRAVISSTSEEEDNGIEQSPITLRKAVKQARKRRRLHYVDSEESSHFSSESEEYDDSNNNSENDERRVYKKRRERISPSGSLKKRCLSFFNDATRTMLIGAPRVTAKLADDIIENRPFNDFEELEETIKSFPRGSGVVNQYLEFLRKCNILESILDDCRRHSEEMQLALQKVQATQIHIQPSSLTKEQRLHPYQKVGLNWLVMMYKLNLNAILADEMGLGKTIQVIAFLSFLKDENTKGPHLIVVPSSTIENWLKEISEWAPKLDVLTYYGSINDRRELRQMAADKKVDILLTTYNMIQSRAEDRKFFKRFKFEYVIYDEGHLLKNCSTDRYKNLMKVPSKRKILLTGTPLQNNLVELISLMFFTMTTLFTKYCDDINQLLRLFQQKIPALEAKNGALYEAEKVAQAKAILRPYVLRRLKNDVLSCLPKKQDRVIRCKMTAEQTVMYEELVNEFRERAARGEKLHSSRVMQLRQIANHPLLYRRLYTDDKLYLIARALCTKEKEYRQKKSDDVAEELSYLTDFAICQKCSKYRSTQKFCLDEDLALDSCKFKELDILLPNIVEKGDKVLIFSQFTCLLDILEIYLRLRKYEYCRLDGSTPVMERQNMIDNFNKCSELSVFLLSTRAGSLGVNLTAANHVIIHDIDFNPYNDKQAEDRCHRMGQKKDVFVVRLISEKSVEEEMYALAEKKLELEKQVTGSIENEETEEFIVEKLLKEVLEL